MRLAASLAVLLLLTACGAEKDADRPESSREFPRAWRPVSDLSGTEFGNEDQRDNLGEAEVVMDLAAIKAGTTVADIGAGEGYYTVRLAERVGAKGRVLAQDIDPGAIQRLHRRTAKEAPLLWTKLGPTSDQKSM